MTDELKLLFNEPDNEKLIEIQLSCEDDEYLLKNVQRYITIKMLLLALDVGQRKSIKAFQYINYDNIDMKNSFDRQKHAKQEDVTEYWIQFIECIRSVHVALKLFNSFDDVSGLEKMINQRSINSLNSADLYCFEFIGERTNICSGLRKLELSSHLILPTRFGNDNVCSIVEALRIYCTAEKNDLYCFQQCPKVLVICLNRYYYSEKKKLILKASHGILIELELNLDQYMMEDIGNSVYILSKIIVHRGLSVQGGHYFIYERRDADQWFCHDDIRVFCTNQTDDEILKRLSTCGKDTTYMLIYNRTS